MSRFCQICGKEIQSKSRTVYCSNTCAIRSSRNRSEYWDAARKADRGAMSELIAAADLLKHGFEVYRNVSPQGSSDLIIRKEKIMLSIEVRTARKDNKTGRIHCPKKNFRSDVLALVFKDEVIYEPPL